MASLLALSLLLPLVSPRQINVTVNASKFLGALPSTARFFGADEPNYATYPDGRELLKQLGDLGPHQTYFRTHNLLTTCDPPHQTSPHRLKWGCTNAYTEDAHGNPIYNFTIIDEIFDAYMENGVKPYAQVGFMPKALSTHPNPYSFHFDSTSSTNVIYTGWSYPPTSWEKWSELVYQWVKHCVERYGKEEVENWYWEIWNEPNIQYWNGTQEQYFTLYDYAVHGVLRALPSATVGGPEVAGGASGDWLSLFLDHALNGENNATRGKGTPLDFISFHAKGSPTFVNATAAAPGHLQMNISAELQNAQGAFDVIHSFEKFKNLPVFISEDDPDSCAACISANVDYRNGLIYPSYTAAAFSREMDLAFKHGINLTGTLTWAFEYDDHPYFDDFRVLSTNQIAKPILNIFRMFGKMQSRRVEATSTGQYSLTSVVDGSVRGDSDVGVRASMDEKGEMLAVMIWNYHDDALPRPDAQVSFNVSNLFHGVKIAQLKHYRIDQSHSNAYATWLAMGSPQNPTRQQLADLKTAGMLQMLHSPTQVNVENGMVGLKFSLPIHAVSLLVLEK